ncbi:MAG: TlpA family protein disulfide reductase [Acidobacteriota bacterium]|nr:TlpA family protein disulfide reductase [Acidobacteriota bacterium]
MPDWKSRYFAPSVWIDDLVMAALGQSNEIPALTTGTPAPDFNLKTTAGESLSLNQYRGRVVLIDFWQTWCPPCVEELPHLEALQKRYGARGLVVLGITGKLDGVGAKELRDLVRDNRIDYPILVDEKGAVASLYDVSGYPHVFIIDESGRLAFEKSGYQRGGELELEQEIQKALARSEK